MERNKKIKFCYHKHVRFLKSSRFERKVKAFIKFVYRKKAPKFERNVIL